MGTMQLAWCPCILYGSLKVGNRDYKDFGEGQYYHIYNRGNEKRSIFLDDDDLSFFIFRLRQNLFPDDSGDGRSVPLPAGAFSLINYCLMPNHFHLLVRQNSQMPTSKLLLRICTSYSKYFNKKYKRVGHVFQDQFKQVLISDNSYLVWLSAYIHQNPKVAGIVDRLIDYKWSSYPDFLELRVDKLCEKEIILSQFRNTQEYQKLVDSSYEIIKERSDLEKLLLDDDD